MKRPSPALVVAGLALFVALGGTGYAASQHRSAATTAASKHKAAPLTAKQVEKLIAAYVKHHHIGAVGAPGLQGAAGATGATGPQGPGAKRIEDIQNGEVTGAKFATVGLWTLTMTCVAGGVEMTINGPGSISYTESFGAFNKPAATASNNGTANGFTSDIGNGNQQGIHAFLTSGSTMEDLNLEITASEGAGHEQCAVLGDAIPTS